MKARFAVVAWVAVVTVTAYSRVWALEGAEGKNRPQPPRAVNVAVQGTDASVAAVPPAHGEVKNAGSPSERPAMPSVPSSKMSTDAPAALSKNTGAAPAEAERRGAGIGGVPRDLAVGTRVVAVIDGPSGNACITAGMTGTVYCFDPADLSLPYLINWDAECGFEQCGICGNCAPHGWWVGFSEIRVFLPEGTRIVSYVDNPAGSDCIPVGAKGTVYCYDAADRYLPYLVNWDLPCGLEQCQICGNCAPHGWWVGFDDISVYLQGTRVVARVDGPSDNGCIGACDAGTVVCYDPNDPTLTYLVDWDVPCGVQQCQVCNACAVNGWWVGFGELGLEIARDFDQDGRIDTCDSDIDNDGIPNDVDVCDWTPRGAWIQPDGSVLGDLDGDCDVDLADHAIMQNRFTGPSSH